MRTLIKLLVSAAFAGITMVASAEDGWMTDIDAALVKAKEAKKSVMVEFTGSDWCPPCIMMGKEVFSKKEFVDKASKKFILVKIDIPNKDPELKAKNSKVLEKYKVQGVPTVILFNPEGKEFERFTASKYRTVESFTAQLDEALAKQDMQ